MVYLAMPGCSLPAWVEGPPSRHKGPECLPILQGVGEVGGLWHLKGTRTYHRAS